VTLVLNFAYIFAVSLCHRYNYRIDFDSSAIRLPFDCESKVIKVTVT